MLSGDVLSQSSKSNGRRTVLANHMTRCFISQLEREKKNHYFGYDVQGITFQVFWFRFLVRCQAINAICILGFPILGPRQIIERKQ